MNEAGKSQIFKGALLLTIAGTISKLLSAGYRIPLQNLTGDFGFYVYQQVYPFLGIMMILSLYGFPSAISKGIAELQSAGKPISLKNFYLPILAILLGIHSLLFLTLWIGAGSVAQLVGDEQLTTAYRYTAFAFLLIPFTSLLRGTFQGQQEMTPTAVSQIAKQLVRVFIIILAAYLYASGKLNVYVIGEWGAIALIIGSVVAILILTGYFLVKKPFQTEQIDKIPWRNYLQSIVFFGMFAVLNHMILLILQMVDVLTLVPQLINYGLAEEKAMALKGVFDRGQPLIQLGTVLGSSIALALLPNISEKRVAGDLRGLQSAVQNVLSVTVSIALAAVVGLILIFPETNILLYKNTEGTLSLQILSVTIFLSSLAITITAILQGLNDYKWTAVYIGITFAVKWLLNILLIPSLGIIGSAMATVLSMLVLFILLVQRMKSLLPSVKWFGGLRWLSLGGALVSMGAVIQLIRFLYPYDEIESRFTLLLYVICLILCGVVVYFYLLYRLRAFQQNEKLYPALMKRIFKRRDSHETFH